MTYEVLRASSTAQSPPAPQPTAVSTIPVISTITRYETEEITMIPNVAIVIDFPGSQISEVARYIEKGIEEAGGSAEIFHLPKLGHKPPGEDWRTITGTSFMEQDAFLLGTSTRCGTMSAEWKSFWDNNDDVWKNGGLSGKLASIFTSTTDPGEGRETTLNMMSTLTHYGIIHVPLGYDRYSEVSNSDEINGGSPWGAGTFSKSDGSCMPTELEQMIAKTHGKVFWETVSKVNF
ncbi:hypothetical protein C0995_014548 [Termitomyces sp. Mi166|nr:hypothetical protein C0995_014548 [Termitomyces sp. Mi166\